MKPLTLALPKGRLQDRMLDLLNRQSISLDFGDRKLIAHDPGRRISAFLVKNSDLPTYVNHGIAGLGVCGDDVLIESRTNLLRLAKLPFGSTRMCLAGLRDSTHTDSTHTDSSGSRSIEVATKFPIFTRDHFHSRGVAVRIIKLNGSVELAPLLGLSPFIVDLVETGTTLKANGLVVLEELRTIEIFLVANPAYYKIHFRRIHELIDSILPEA